MANKSIAIDMLEKEVARLNKEIDKYKDMVNGYRAMIESCHIKKIPNQSGYDKDIVMSIKYG